MPARPPPPSASFITPARATRSAKCTKVPRRWTGWSRSRSAASRSRRLRRPRSGRASVSTSSTPPATSTLPSKSSVRCACSTARCACSIPTRALSHRPRPSGARAIAIQLPIGSENNFKGLVDLVRMKGVVWEEEKLDAKFVDIDIPADMVEKAKEYREKLLEAAVELDDEVLAAYLDGKEPDEATLKRMIRKAVLTGAFFPVLCGSAFKNKGVQPLLDAVVDYLPSPVDVPAIKGVDEDGNEIVRLPDDKEPLALLAFKIMDDPFVGTITFCRIYSGTLLSGTGVI